MMAVRDQVQAPFDGTEHITCEYWNDFRAIASRNAAKYWVAYLTQRPYLAW